MAERPLKSDTADSLVGAVFPAPSLSTVPFCCCIFLLCNDAAAGAGSAVQASITCKAPVGLPGTFCFLPWQVRVLLVSPTPS